MFGSTWNCVRRCGLQAPSVWRSLGTSSGEAVPGTLIPKEEVKRFVSDCMVKIGTPVNNAEALAEVLISADYRGHYSHGLNRLDLYVKDVSSKVCDSEVTPTIVKESAATGFINGNNGLGPVVGNFCMQLAIKKAKEAGVGWVVANNSNHYGIAGYYSLQAMEQKLIGMSFTNTSPFMVPTRSKVPALGTNPITVAAAGLGNDQFVLDMATTAVAVGKIELQRRKGEKIPYGWAQDKEGAVTTDSVAAMDASCLMPLGGTEINSGYKGYGLGLMVELFCGILAGSAYGPNIRKWMTATTPANLGQCFVAVDPSCFAPGFEERLSDIISQIKNLTPVDSSNPVLIAGEPEVSHMNKVDAAGGIRYHINQINASKTMARDLGVQEMKSAA
ncbi:unnamed protein product [Allacma fusca]|uniref:Malate dehydrogenase n=1 Tax=Allacma fusca TaxID=39272 RepID=A0A8J2JVL2_9HEXA|nr:unnamed protein product [Allacma fusca]